MVVGVVSKYVAEKGSVSDVSIFRCSFCWCEFSSQFDLDSHLAVFGKRNHAEALRKLHRSVYVGVVRRKVYGYCFCGVKSGDKPKLVYEAVDSLVLCPACRHFRLMERDAKRSAT
jgi:hypothetical protein